MVFLGKDSELYQKGCLKQRALPAIVLLFKTADPKGEDLIYLVFLFAIKAKCFIISQLNKRRGNFNNRYVFFASPPTI